MRLVLFSQGYPSGRCILLASELHRSATLSGDDAMQLAERLFDAQFTAESPANVESVDAESADRLARLCSEFGITVVAATQSYDSSGLTPL